MRSTLVGRQRFRLFDLLLAFSSLRDEARGRDSSRSKACGVSESEMRKLAKSGEDMGSADRGSIATEPTASFGGIWSAGACCSGRAYVCLAFCNVANRPSLTGTGAKGNAETDDAELTEEVREFCDDVSDTIDSGDEREESEREDGRRLRPSSGGVHRRTSQRQSVVVRPKASR